MGFLQVSLLRRLRDQTRQPPISEFLIEKDESRRAYSRSELLRLSLIHISEPTRQAEISYAVFCLKKKLLFKIASDSGFIGNVSQPQSAKSLLTSLDDGICEELTK